VRADRPRLVLAVIVAADMMLVLDGTVMNIALPHIRDGLHFSVAALSWVMNAYMLTFGSLLLLGGRAGDLFGRRRLFIAGVAIFTACSLAGGLAVSPAILVAARIGQGAGAAAAGPSTLALLVTTFPERRAETRALAVLSGVSSAGLALGLILGGVLTDITTWRSVLLINVPIGMAVGLLSSRLLREPERHPARLDLPGAALAVVTAATLVFGLSHAASAGWSAPATTGCLAIVPVLLVALVAVERRARRPLLPLWLLADPRRAAAYLEFVLLTMVMVSMFYFLTQYLQGITGLNALETGASFLPFAATVFVMTRLSGRLLPRFGPRPLVACALLLPLGSLIWLAQLGPATPMPSGFPAR
jgi:EmrB/QacA subfamily drug resistance transporter